MGVGEERFIVLVLSWFSWNYFPYVFLTLRGISTYPFYVIPAMPAAALGTAYLLGQRWMPRWAVAVYLAGAFLFFLTFYPDKAVLPSWLRGVFYY